MKKKAVFSMAVAGAAAGAVNGLFSAGGGLVLVPLLLLLCNLQESEIFPTSIVIILPICIVSLLSQFPIRDLPWNIAWPYLLGSIPGGILTERYGKRIPVVWLHRILGVLILYGGVKYLW